MTWNTKDIYSDFSFNDIMNLDKLNAYRGFTASDQMAAPVFAIQLLEKVSDSMLDQALGAMQARVVLAQATTDNAARLALLEEAFEIGTRTWKNGVELKAFDSDVEVDKLTDALLLTIALLVAVGGRIEGAVWGRYLKILAG